MKTRRGKTCTEWKNHKITKQNFGGFRAPQQGQEIAGCRRLVTWTNAARKAGNTWEGWEKQKLSTWASGRTQITRKRKHRTARMPQRGTAGPTMIDTTSKRKSQKRSNHKQVTTTETDGLQNQTRKIKRDTTTKTRRVQQWVKQWPGKTIFTHRKKEALVCN